MGNKYPENPVIEGSQRDPTQSYPPTVLRVDGTYFCITKTETNDLVGFVSEDGVNWQEENKHVLKRSAAGWDQKKVTLPLLRYDPDLSIYHLYYAGHLPTGNVAVGYANSGEPLKGYQKVSDNPICEPSDLNEELNNSSEFDRIIVSDLVKTNGEFVFYGTAKSTSGKSIIWTANGSDWTDIGDFSVLLSSSELDQIGGGPLLQSPSVILLDGTYVMQFTSGVNATVLNERQLYVAFGKSQDEFTLVPEALLEPGPETSWDERRVYAAQWLKQQDGRYLQPEMVNGKIRLYYSGHDLGHHNATSWQNKLHHPSIGTCRNVEQQSLLKLIARYCLTRVRRYGSVVFDYNRGYTGLAEFPPEELRKQFDQTQ